MKIWKNKNQIYLALHTFGCLFVFSNVYSARNIRPICVYNLQHLSNGHQRQQSSWLGRLVSKKIWCLQEGSPKRKIFQERAANINKEMNLNLTEIQVSNRYKTLMRSCKQVVDNNKKTWSAKNPCIWKWAWGTTKR